MHTLFFFFFLFVFVRQKKPFEFPDPGETRWVTASKGRVMPEEPSQIVLTVALHTPPFIPGIEASRSERMLQAENWGGSKTWECQEIAAHLLVAEKIILWLWPTTFHFIFLALFPALYVRTWEMQRGDVYDNLWYIRNHRLRWVMAI